MKKTHSTYHSYYDELRKLTEKEVATVHCKY